VAPRAAALDAQTAPLDCYPSDLIAKADAWGLRKLTLDPAWGGAGADSLTAAMAIEALAKGDLGVSVILAQTLKIAQVMQQALSPEQQARVLPVIAADREAVLAIAITEPDRASDYFLAHPAPFATTARRAEGGWILNGMKHFISNANRARFLLVFAQSDPQTGLEHGATCFLIERGAAGFEIGRIHDKMGERLANNAELYFRDCFVPDENVVGEVGRGFQVLTSFFPQSNAYAGASVLGVAAAAYERALAWAGERVQGGKPLIAHDGIRAQLAEMRMLIDAARSYIHRAAWLADRAEQGWDASLGILPKVMASQAAWKVATWCLELHGGYGYMKETGVEKLLRDAAAFLHSDGANRTLLLKAADALGWPAATARESPIP